MSCERVEQVRTVVLCLGNDLLADDGIGMLAADRLRHELPGSAEVISTTQSGLALLDHLIGYDRAIIIDAIHTGNQPAGKIRRLAQNDLKNAYAPSPHYAGLPEMFAIAHSLSLKFPPQVDLLAIEVADTQTIGGVVSDQVMASLDTLVKEVEAILESNTTRVGPNA
jgi:hydrogenase maturation protease